jgi:hypothetical protein
MSEARERTLAELDEELPDPCCRFCGVRFDPGTKRECASRDAGVC